MNIGQILTLTANKFPDRIAIVFENPRSTYQMSNDRVNRLSLALFHMGLSKRERYPLFSSIQMLSSAYAGDHGLGRGGMRDAGSNHRGDGSVMLRRISHSGG